MNKNILKTASVLSACLFFVTACGDRYTDKVSKKTAFDEAFCELIAFKKALNSTECPDPDILSDLKKRWEESGGPLHIDSASLYNVNDVTDMTKLLEAHHEIAEFKNLELAKGNKTGRYAAIKEALTSLIKKVDSLENLGVYAKRLYEALEEGNSSEKIKVLLQAVRDFAEDKKVLALAKSLSATT